ncbi:MAG: putative pterin-4-alpha-carbinolamine dehydratase [Phycisphaerae bacterium]|nr:putative pterin-4-alpha-carbinolamine dehydratase [Phycisphaerae bacterium]
MSHRLTAAEYESFLARLPAWAVINDHHLRREYKFPDFVTALAYVNRVGALAEQLNHHPDLHLSWGLVAVEIWTHDVNGLTESDFQLAQQIEKISSH